MKGALYKRLKCGRILVGLIVLTCMTACGAGDNQNNSDTATQNDGSVDADSEFNGDATDGGSTDGAMTNDEDHSTTTGENGNSGNSTSESESSDNLSESDGEQDEDLLPPAIPRNFRATAHNDNEIELFWDEVTNPQAAIKYQLLRDNEELAVLESVGFYDTHLAPNTTYQYTLRTVDEEGRQSQPVSLNVTTLETVATINAENVTALVRQITSIVNEEFLGDFINTGVAVATFKSYEPDAYINAGFEYLSSDYPTLTVRDYYRCIENEGSVRVTSGEAPFGGNAEFDSCASFLLDGQSVDGVYGTFSTPIYSTYNSGTRHAVFFTELQIGSSTQSRAMHGALYIDQASRTRVSWRTDNDYYSFDYQRSDDAGVSHISDLGMVRQAGRTTDPNGEPWSQALSTDFQLRAPVTKNKSIAISTLVPFFTLTQGSCYQSGTLRAEATDGTWLELSADTGNDNTYSLSVGDTDSSSTEVHAWNASTILRPLKHDVSAPSDDEGNACANIYLEHGQW